MNNELILENLSWAEGLARQTKRRVPPWVSLDDLKSVAYEFLVAAARSYDSSQVPFRSYAFIRITGGMFNYVTWLKRSQQAEFEAYVQAEEPCEVVTLLVKSVPVRLREMFLMRYRDGMSKEEIALACDKMPSSVTTELSLSRRTIAREWRGREHELFAKR